MLRLGAAAVLQRSRGKKAVLLAVAALFVAGVAAGSLAVNTLPANQEKELASLIDRLFYRLSQSDPLPAGDVFIRSLGNNLRLAALLWLLGTSTAGIPLTFAAVFLRGFVSGFTVGFLIYERGLEGLLVGLFAVVPGHVIAVPALFAMAVTSVSFAFYRRERHMRAGKGLLTAEFGAYTAIMAVLTVVLSLSSLVDGFAGPLIIRLTMMNN